MAGKPSQSKGELGVHSSDVSSSRKSPLRITTYLNEQVEIILPNGKTFFWREEEQRKTYSPTGYPTPALPIGHRCNCRSPHSHRQGAQESRLVATIADKVIYSPVAFNI